MDIDYISTAQTSHGQAGEGHGQRSGLLELCELRRGVGLIILANWHRILKLEFLHWPPHLFP